MNFPLSAGLLEACVLAELNRQDVYGYQLTQQLRQVLDISESTLYPVLRRLQKEACLTTYDQPCQGRNQGDIIGLPPRVRSGWSRPDWNGRIIKAE